MDKTKPPTPVHRGYEAITTYFKTGRGYYRVTTAKQRSMEEVFHMIPNNEPAVAIKTNREPHNFNWRAPIYTVSQEDAVWEKYWISFGTNQPGCGEQWESRPRTAKETDDIFSQVDPMMDEIALFDAFLGRQTEPGGVFTCKGLALFFLICCLIYLNNKYLH